MMDVFIEETALLNLSLTLTGFGRDTSVVFMLDGLTPFLIIYRFFLAAVLITLRCGFKAGFWTNVDIEL